MIQKIILLLTFCCFSFYGIAQEQLGLRTENYSGINSILLNPANNLTTPFQWDVNLIAIAQFVDNNFGGFQQSSISKLLDSNNELYLATDFNSDREFPAGSVVFDFNEPGKNKFVSASANIMGPSILLNFEKFSIGLFTNFRAAVSGQKIPAILGYYDYEAIMQGDNYTVFPSQVAGMIWSEIGLNYLLKKETGNGQIGIGINLKYLQGYESFFVKNNTKLDITKMELDALTFNNGADIDFGFTTSSVDEEDVNLNKNGQGFGGDFGITFATNDYQDGYGFKFGLSVLDIGKIKFDKNTEAHKVDIDNSFFFNPRNFSDETDFREALDQLNQELFTDTTTTLVGGKYEVWLPGAFSLQADFAVKEHIFLNATLVQRMPIGNLSLERGNIFALTPRYESRWFSAFLPISIYNWQNVKIGTALRLGYLTIGSEDLLSFMGKKNLTGTDFYVAFKINPFNLGWKKGGGKRGKAVKCYEF